MTNSSDEIPHEPGDKLAEGTQIFASAPLALPSMRQLGLKPLQIIVCRIKEKVEGGYNVAAWSDFSKPAPDTLTDGLPGFLCLDSKAAFEKMNFEPGEITQGRFVCISNNRLLITPTLNSEVKFIDARSHGYFEELKRLLSVREIADDSDPPL